MLGLVPMELQRDDRSRPSRQEWRSGLKWIAVLAIAVWLLNLFVSWVRSLLSWA